MGELHEIVLKKFRLVEYIKSEAIPEITNQTVSEIIEAVKKLAKDCTATIRSDTAKVEWISLPDFIKELDKMKGGE